MTGASPFAAEDANGQLPKPIAPLFPDDLKFSLIDGSLGTNDAEQSNLDPDGFLLYPPENEDREDDIRH